MMDVAQALNSFWSQFGVPVYFDDLVPDDAVLPYITINVSRSGFGGQDVLTAYSWHRDTLGGNIERTQMLDQIADAIPVGGVMLPVGDGYIILRQNDAGFQQFWQDDTDADVIGGRTSYIVQYYIM